MQIEGLKVGERIKGIRMSKGMSQRDVEKLTGILASHQSRFECGHTYPSMKTLANLAKAFGCSIKEFFV